MPWPFISRRERIRREASDWIARLNGPFDPHDLASFERWRTADPDHAAAYDRISALFQAAARTRPDESSAASPSRRQWVPVAALAATAVLALIIGATWLAIRPGAPGSATAQQQASFTASGSSRQFRLADGSVVTLSPGSALDVRLTASNRDLHLLRGEGGFDVAHEERPFVVAAAGTEVIARGTQFLVALAGGQTRVRLIQGKVDVRYPPLQPLEPRRVRHLVAGQSVIVPAPVAGGAGPDAAAPAMLRFNETPLGDAIARMEEGRAARILLGRPELGRLRVTGAFRAGDAAGFAESVAVAFGLAMDHLPDGRIRLRRPD